MSGTKAKIKLRNVKKPVKPKVKKATAKKAPKRSKTQKKIERGLKSKKIQAMVAKAKKKYGDRVQGFANPMKPVEVFRTGYPQIDDEVLGSGGIVRGVVGELFGPESGGKTTIALGILASAQRQGLTVAFVDMEHSMTPEYAAANGINIDEWLYFKPLYGEECCEMILMCMNAGIDITVVDSWGALFTKDSVEKDIDKAEKMGGRSRLIERTVNKSLDARHTYDNMLICINQMRDNIGAMPFEEKQKSSGGNHWRHACHWRIKVTKGKKNKDSKTGVVKSIGVNLYGAKNKGGPPFQRSTMEIQFGTGISLEGSILDEAMRLQVLTRKRGDSWVKWASSGESLGNGRDKCIQLLSEDPELFKVLMNEVEAKRGNEPEKSAYEYEEDDDLPYDESLEGLGDFSLKTTVSLDE